MFCDEGMERKERKEEEEEEEEGKKEMERGKSSDLKAKSG